MLHLRVYHRSPVPPGMSPLAVPTLYRYSVDFGKFPSKLTSDALQDQQLSYPAANLVSEETVLNACRAGGIPKNYDHLMSIQPILPPTRDLESSF